MKRPTSFYAGLVIALFLTSFQLFSQNLVPFSPRYDSAIKGDMLLIGNSNVGVHVSDPYNGTDTNDRLDAAVFVDIDGDPATFNSSSADLNVPSDLNCYRIVYAGLYWSAVVNGTTPISNIKFKVPGGSYADITGTQLYFQNAATNDQSNTYAFYHDVTDMLTALPDPEGTYTVANISSMVGLKPNQEGLSAGWSLFVVYEDPLLPSKYITSFDGFTKITSTINETFPVSGFQTIPVGPVRAKYAFSTIEGDRRWVGDYLELNGTAINATNSSGTVIREADNFFNSTSSIINPITNTPEIMTQRVPDGSNTLGFDSGIINIPNAGNTLIANGATSAEISLGSNLDIYYFYFNAFAIEIIAPNIVLTKIVEDALGNDIEGEVVDLGDELYYTIGFQNNGNDDATDLTIRDILPTNIVFNYPEDIENLPTGVTVQSYNETTRELIFRVDRDIVEENDPVSEIRFKVTVVSTCSLLSDACSNIIDNQAYATYKGTINPDFVISDDPSFNSNTGCLLTPGATNFLADINDCTFIEEVALCGDNVTLTAGNGYDSYSWSTSPTGTPVIGTNQSITVSDTGTYYVQNTAIAPCQSTEQEFVVAILGTDVANPVIPFADEVVTCPNDGKLLPNIFLCGANDSRFIQTNITDTTSMIWEKLDETSCAAVVNQDCANEDMSCTWNQVGEGSDFTVDTVGQYKLTLNYAGGCFRRFYFNVYTNLLEPTVRARDIYCLTPGEIVVGGVPNGYEYSLDGTNFQSSNTFSVTTANTYTVYIRQIGVTPNPCIFTVPDVQIRDRDFTVSNIISQPLCNGELGGIAVAANDVRPQYFFSISQGGVEVNSVGPITERDYKFENLNPGTYTVEVSTEDGCTYTEDVEIIDPPILSATAALTTPLTCEDGEITVYPVGGTAPYYYFVNSTTVFQSVPTIAVSTPGTYNITVLDANNCPATTTIEVDAILEPEYNIVKSDILCADATNSGSITINVTNANGTTLEFSVDGGTTFTNSPVFNGLAVGDYDVVVRHSLNGSACDSSVQTINITSAPEITGTANVSTPYTCNSSGAITVSGVTGGTPPYTYSIDGLVFQPNNTFTGLTDGSYSITIRDASNCLFTTVPAVIESLNPPSDLDFSSTPLSCPANISNVTVSVTGGNTPFEYQIIAPASAVTAYQTSNAFVGLAPNTYTFRVRDSKGCIYTKSFTIAPLPPLNFNTVLTKDLDCTASPDAVITGSISGGTAPYSFAVSFNGGSYGSLSPASSTFTYMAASAGNYQLQITDSSGCTIESGIQIVNAIVSVTASSDPNNPTCDGFDDGLITLNGLTGQPPFTYSIDNGSTFLSSGTFSGLSSGTYNYVVRDSKNCEVSGSVVLNDPAPLDVTVVRNSVQCDPTDVNGSFDVSINSGGNPPFVYTLYDRANTQVGSSVSTTSTSHTFDDLLFGDYYVTVIDANGCEYRSNRLRIETEPNISLVSNVAGTLCTDGATVDISVTSGSGSYTYSIYGQPATSFGPTNATTHSFTNLDHGVTYQFQVEDSGGCFSTLEVTTPVLSSIDINTLTATDVNCFGEDDGTVDFTVSNYDPSVTTLYYEILDELTNSPISPAQNGTITGLSGGTASGSVSGLSAGNYTLLVREDNGTLCTTSQVFEISQPIQSLVSSVASNTNANCNSNAEIVLSTRGGTKPYQYAAGASGFTPASGDFVTSNVLYLDYAVRTNWDIVVRDANGCEDRLNENIDIDPEPIVAASLNTQCSITEGNFVIDVTLTTPGVTPYSYSIDGGAFQTRAAPFSVTNLSSGTHTIELRDANGCGNLVSVDIEAPLELIPEVTAVPTCSDNDGIITLTTTGGTGDYTYTLSPNPSSVSLTGDVFSSVPSGNYTITVLDNITACTVEKTVFLPSATPPTLTAQTSPVTCYGNNNGSIALTLSGYSGPYNYEVFNSAGVSVTGTVSANTSTTPLVITGMLADSYTVEITETAVPFCTASTTAIIQSPTSALQLDANETSNVTCDNDRGTISAIATGGWGNYEYELTGASTVAYSSNGTFTNLAAGLYTVNVRDAGGCIIAESIQLDIPNPIDAIAQATSSNLSCFGYNNGTIEVTSVTGGQSGNYSYTLNMLSPTTTSSGPQTSSVFNNLVAGTYEVIVTDGYNCSFTSQNVVISEPSQIQATLVKETSQTCLTSASLTLSATGGTGVYTFSDSPSFSSIIGTFTSSTTFAVTPGIYQYYVRDANGCITMVSNEIRVDELTPLSLQLDTKNASINCAGDNTGVIVARAEGGLGNYTYTLQDGSGNDILPAPVQTSPGIFENLSAGLYQVSVESGDCLATSAEVNITEPSIALTANPNVTHVTCAGTNDGTLEIQASGGTGIIKYAISPQLNQFFESSIFEDLAPGDYQGIAQDELGCFVLFDFTIEEAVPVVLTIVPDSMIPEVCGDDMNGEFSIEISGGNLPYSVVLDDIEGDYFTGTATQTQFDFADLVGGDHIVYVRDALGCTSEWNIAFPDSVIINPEITIEYSCLNNVAGNIVTVNTDASIEDLTDLDYSLNGGPFQGSNIFIDVPAGTAHFVDVRHTNGCIQQTTTFDIEQSEPLAMELEIGEELNQIVAHTSGGVGPFEFTLNDVSKGEESTFSIYESGYYTVTVTDSYGCAATDTKYFEYIDICILNYFTPNGDGDQDEWGPGCTSQYENLEFDIFDRYGRKVASLGVGEKWDGKYQGRELPTGDYWYVVRLNDVVDDRDFVGHFTLYR